MTMSKSDSDDDKDSTITFESDHRIILKLATANRERAQNFLFDIAEPVKRDERTHEYRLTMDSLHSGMFFGLTTQSIIDSLRRFSEGHVPLEITNYIRSCTEKYGKVRLVLQHSRYFMESSDPTILRNLCGDSQIQQCRLPSTDNPAESDRATHPDELSMGVIPDKIVKLRKRCQELDYPLLEEYHFEHDSMLKHLSIKLAPNAILRPYQDESLRKMFSNGRARSGLIILPCGAGKSLVGVAATCQIKKSCLVLCNSNVSVEQWQEQFQRWSTIDEPSIRLFTSEHKNVPTDSCIYISTYQMIAPAQGRTTETRRVMELISRHEWGLMLLDEVHTAPADSFRLILTTVHAHIRLGLTATPVREDERIKDLEFLVGPNLYEANWMELQKCGFIAKVFCAEVQCPMIAEFLREYSIAASNHIKRRLSVLNPNKFRTCQYLIKYHEGRNDKIIVFCDDPDAIDFYAKRLGKALIHGEVSDNERMRVLQNFQRNPKIQTVFISRVGDTSFDLPEANVVIQISSHGSSRRQEAQRLGRILRTKKDAHLDENNAFFYSLVSLATDEMDHLKERQCFLVEKGYSYQTLTQTELVSDEEGLHFSTNKEQQELLEEILDEPARREQRKAEKLAAKKRKAAPAKPRHWLFEKHRK